MNTQITIQQIITGTGETVGWSVLRNKSEKIAGFASLFDACEFVTQQEQITGRIKDGGMKELIDLVAACPTSLQCCHFHHAKADQHGHDEACKPMDRYYAAIEQARRRIEGNKE